MTAMPMVTTLPQLPSPRFQRRQQAPRRRLANATLRTPRTRLQSECLVRRSTNSWRPAEPGNETIPQGAAAPPAPAPAQTQPQTGSLFPGQQPTPQPPRPPAWQTMPIQPRQEQANSHRPNWRRADAHGAIVVWASEHSHITTSPEPATTATRSEERTCVRSILKRLAISLRKTRAIRKGYFRSLSFVSSQAAGEIGAWITALPLSDDLQDGGLNNRAENSHQPFRRRERAMQRFRSMKTLLNSVQYTSWCTTNSISSGTSSPGRLRAETLDRIDGVARPCRVRRRL
jgi:hypothetical protein